MNPRVHLCILTTGHPVDDVRVYEKFCVTFLDAGFDVTWVGPDSDYFGRRPGQSEKLRFVLFRRGRNRFQRLKGYWDAYRLGSRVKDVDVYYAPEPESAALAVRLARANRGKTIFDIHEVFHGPILSRWVGSQRMKFARELIRRWISRICSRCDLVIGVSDSVLSGYTGDGTERIVVRSCAPASFARPLSDESQRRDRTKFTVMHGKCNLGRGTLQVLDALVIAKREIGDFRAIMFRQPGNHSTSADQPVIEKIRQLGVEDIVDLRPGVPMQMMPDILQTCDVGLIAYGRELGVDSLPNRLFEYMAAGMAIIAPEYAREMAQIIRSEKCGLLVDFEKPEAVAQAIIQLSQHPDECREMGRRARIAFDERHNWQTEVRPVVERIRAWSVAQSGVTRS